MIEYRALISVEDVLKRVSADEIFRRYIPNFRELNTRFCSNIREDKDPSACVYEKNGKIAYKDFKTGEVYSCFDYVMNLYNVGFREALEIVWNDLDLKDREKNQLYITTEPSRSVIIKIRSKDYSEEDLKYWSEYGVSEETLISYSVRSITHYWINEHRFSVDKLGFAYVYNEGFKIYQPLSGDKWFSNARNVLQGYNQLSESGDLLLITSSQKDVMLLSELGYCAVAPSSETAFIQQNILDELKNRFRRVIIYYNNDKPGIDAATKLAENYKLPYINNPEGSPKDPSDYYKILGKDRLIILLDNNLNNECRYMW